MYRLLCGAESFGGWLSPEAITERRFSSKARKKASRSIRVPPCKVLACRINVSRIVDLAHGCVLRVQRDGAAWSRPQCCTMWRKTGRKSWRGQVSAESWGECPQEKRQVRLSGD
jgi:hypothetical protein